MSIEPKSKLEIAVLLQRAGLAEREALTLGKKAADPSLSPVSSAEISPAAYLRYRADEIEREIATRQEKVNALRTVAAELDAL